MENKDKPAYPTQDINPDSGNVESFKGLTKREIFAMTAMQGILYCRELQAAIYSNCNIDGTIPDNAIQIYAIKMADELLKQLENGNNTGTHQGKV